MPLIKCDYCPARFRPQQKALHEKHCREARRAKRKSSDIIDIPIIEKKKRGRPKKK